MGNTGLSTQLTHGDETTYGTVAATLTRAWEIREENVEDAIDRIESQSLRAGKRLESYWKANRKGAGGEVQYELADRNFGVRFKHMLGGTPTVTTHAGGTLSKDIVTVLGPLNGKSFTTQIGRPDVTGTTNPFTCLGGKVASWQIAVELDGLVMLTETLDFQNQITPSTPAAGGGPGPALASASYPATPTLLDFIGAKLNVAGSAVDVTSLTLSGDNHSKLDRYFIRQSSLKKEPLEETEPREFGAEINGEFDGLTAYNRFVNGTEATLQAVFQGPIIEGAINSGLTIDFARVRWDAGTPNAQGADIIEQPQTCKVLAPSSGEAVTFTYVTTDTAA